MDAARRRDAGVDRGSRDRVCHRGVCDARHDSDLRRPRGASRAPARGARRDGSADGGPGRALVRRRTPGARVAGEPLLRYLGPFFVDSATGVLKDRLVPAGVITALPVAVSLSGILAGFALYRNRREVTLGALGRFFSQQWYIETLYDAVIVTPAKRLAHLLADVVETRGIDGAVNGVGALVGRAGLAVRGLQTGFVRNYAAAILAGTILMLGYWLFR